MELCKTPTRQPLSFPAQTGDMLIDDQADEAAACETEPAF